MRNDAQRNREHLLATARTMTRDGVPPTHNELAREAGVGVATVYRHFPDSDAMMTALMDAPLADLVAVVERARAEGRPEDALRRLFLDALELEIANPMVAHLVHAPETTSPEAQRVLATLADGSRAVMARARRARLVRPGFTGEDLCRLLLGIESAARGASDPAAVARRYAEVVLAGLRIS